MRLYRRSRKTWPSVDLEIFNNIMCATAYIKKEVKVEASKIKNKRFRACLELLNAETVYIKVYKTLRLVIGGAKICDNINWNEVGVMT